MEVLKNNMINSFSVLSQKIVQIVNSEKFITVINTLSKSINVFIAIAAKALDLMSSIGSVIYDSWSILSPVIQGVSASVLTFVTVTGVVTKAIKIWTAAQAALNAVTMANPIILIISAVIGALYLGVAAFNKFAGTSVSATGIIVGAIYTSFTVVKNFVASIWNVLVGSMQLISNIVLSGVEFLMNALFGNPIKAIANLIVDCVQLVLDYIRMIAKMSDTVLGTNFTKNIDSWKSSLDGFREKFVGKNTIELGRTDFSSYMINNTKSPIQAFIDGHNAVKNLGSNEQNNTERLLGNIAINTKKVADSMDTSVEEIKYLRDVAEMEVINKFTTAEVKVDFGGITNQISNNADVDELIYNIGSKLTETLSSVANGRYN